MEIAILIGAACLTASATVPAHRYTLWGLFEFSGWVAPIADRMTDGLVLYSDGGHSPMPPLSYVLLQALGGGRPTWFTESLAIGVAQALVILTMYTGLSLWFPRPVPFLACFASIPVYYAIPKTVFFDAMAQVVVAAIGVIALFAPSVLDERVMTPTVDQAHRAAGSRRVAFLILIAGLCAVLVLTKQSTGTGALVGVLVAVAVVPRYRSAISRLRSASLFIVFFLASSVGISLLLSRQINVRGMIDDVFLAGSEPKGGTGFLFQHLADYSVETLASVAVWFIYGIAFWAVLSGSREGGTTAARPAFRPPSIRNAATTYCLPMVGPLLLLSLDRLPSGVRARLEAHLPVLMLSVLWGGSIVAFSLCVRTETDTRGSVPAGRDRRARAAMFAVLLSCAVFHSLSVDSFRWMYDNNPLVALAAAGFIICLLQLPAAVGSANSPSVRRLSDVSLALVCCVLWGHLGTQLRLSRQCTRQWPEIPYLRNALLPPYAESVRRLVSLVHQCAPDKGKDCVMLLPSDPDVEQWIQWPRPKLSCALLFPDHYWDRYVESDFARLLADPPKVIVTGPRDNWRGFAEHWTGNWGYARLADMVAARLLPKQYQLVYTVEIAGFGRKDYADVYVRRPPPER